VKYCVVHNQVKILFMSTTSISEIFGIDLYIPQYGFELVEYETITSHCKDTTYLSGIFDNLFSCICKYSLKLDKIRQKCKLEANFIEINFMDL
jgi:hypothetical protein